VNQEYAPTELDRSNRGQSIISSTIKSVLAVGAADVASLAASANRSGYRVYAVDYYGDQDLKQSSVATLSVARQEDAVSYGNVLNKFSGKALLSLAERLCESHQVDVSLLSSGLDDCPAILSELNRLVPILGNAPELFRSVRDRSSFFAEIRRLAIDHPETMIAENNADAKRIARDIGFPVLIKPIEGFGGGGIRKASNIQELEEVLRSVRQPNGKVIVQEYVSGRHASVSVMSVFGKALALAVSEQLLGIHEVGQQEPFGYCGNIVPLSESDVIIDRCKVAAERVIAHFGLVGSNGVDIVISEEGRPQVIEVNPRFQGTIECVERVLGLKLVETHVRACQDRILPQVRLETKGFCVRLVLFAKQRSIIPDLGGFEECRDVPFPGTVIEKGDPLCSVVVQGHNRSLVLERAKEISSSIYNSLSPAGYKGERLEVSP